MLTADETASLADRAVRVAREWLAPHPMIEPSAQEQAPANPVEMLVATSAEVQAFCVAAPTMVDADADVVLPALAVAACWAHDLESAAMLLWAAARAGLRSCPPLDSVARYLLARQRPDGSFGPAPALLRVVAPDGAGDPLDLLTVPLTAWCVRALTEYFHLAADGAEPAHPVESRSISARGCG